MRYLKRKIQLKQEAHSEECEDLNLKPVVKVEASVAETAETMETADSEIAHSPEIQEFVLPMRRPRQKPASPEGNSKNIVKNYGKALCSFGSSSIAHLYIENIIEKENLSSVKIPEFMNYIKAEKEKVNSINSLRKLLVVDAEDNEEIAAYKKIFKEVSVVFLKYFAANWIYSGKLLHKSAHLKFRFKMLRRVQKS